MMSFVEGRTQAVAIDGQMSSPQNLEYGLPQGSVLAPLLYILYTCDVPDLPHNHTVAVSESNVDCNNCGNIVAFIDDCTYSIAAEDSKSLSEQLTVQYNRISEYMASNGLSINDDKLHLIVFTNKGKEEERTK